MTAYRTFFAIDERSSVKPATLQKLLALSLPRQLYEVFPLEEHRFPCVRLDQEKVTWYASREAGKVLERYEDVFQCIVVAGAEARTHEDPHRIALFDFAAIARRGAPRRTCLLNPSADEFIRNTYHASTPVLQQELAERALELAEIGLA